MTEPQAFLEKPEDPWATAFQRSAVAVACSTVGFMLIGFAAGLATPQGWAAWRVGLLLGAIGATLSFAISLCASVIYVDEFHDERNKRNKK